MASKPVLYGSLTSPTVNAVVIALRALDVDYELRDVKPLKGENLTEEYLNKNPTGTIPALETEDHQFIGDSHAIISYVADRYAKEGADDSLYPRDFYKRAKVHQLQHFANSVMFATCVKPAFRPLFSRLTNKVPEETVKAINEAFDMMQRFLNQNKWAAADHVTIADFSCITCIFALYYLKPFTAESHPRLMDWYQRMMDIPYVNETLYSDTMKGTLQFLDKYVIKA
ncbi:glutathione S-transferase 1 [Stomoxys calcitrans]|uniref:glutathione S-transferase 1 n=1 Tax=Stomoxys calcitrans TaxID=35570 RepID=UPI0027E32949|nr:glutathione S-transferase 1 [Stomoxys calcitrans]